MRKLSAVLLVMCGCFGAPDSSGPTPLDTRLRLTNSYVDAIFNVTVYVWKPELVDGGVPDVFVLMKDERVETNGTVTKPFRAFEGDIVGLDVNAVTLGMQRSFPRGMLDDAPARRGREDLRVIFDYDLARASFGLQYGWQ